VSISGVRRSLDRCGRSAGQGPPDLAVRERLTSFTVKPNRDDLRFLKRLIEADRMTRVIDRSYRLDEVPAALRYLEEGHAQGKVVVTV